MLNILPYDYLGDMFFIQYLGGGCVGSAYLLHFLSTVICQSHFLSSLNGLRKISHL